MYWTNLVLLGLSVGLSMVFGLKAYLVPQLGKMSPGRAFVSDGETGDLFRKL